MAGVLAALLGLTLLFALGIWGFCALMRRFFPTTSEESQSRGLVIPLPMPGESRDREQTRPLSEKKAA